MFKKFWILFSAFAYEDTRHPFEFLIRYFYLFISVLIYRFFFDVVLSQKNIQLDDFSMPYPVFLISGVAAMHLIYLAIKVVDGALLSLRSSGVIDWVLISHSSFWELFAAKALWYFFLGLTEFSAIIVSSRLVLGVSLRPFLSPMLFLALLVLFLIYMAIGALVSCLILVFRRGYSLFTFVNQLSILFGGVFFPVKSFPGPLKMVAQIMPITHGLKLIRYLIAVPNTGDTIGQIVLLGIATIFSLLLGFVFFKYSLAYAIKNDLLINEN